MTFDAPSHPNPPSKPPLPSDRDLRWLVALTLPLCAYCTFPEYDFSPEGSPAGGAGGGGGSAGTGANAGAGAGPSAGAGGATVGGAGGAAGSTSCDDCQFVVATTTSEMYGVVSDGESVYWSEYNVNLGLSTIFARAADGSGSVRTVMEAGALPVDEIVIDLVADQDALYGLLKTDTNDEFPQNHAIVRIPKDGGPPTGLLNSGQGRSFFFPTLGENLICVLRDIDFLEPADVFCVDKTGDNPVQLTDNAFSLVSVEGDEAIVVDAGGDIEYLKRPSSSQGTESRPLLPSDANPRPLPVEGAFDGEAYYFLTSGLLKSLPRNGPGDFTLLSTGEAQQTRALRIEDGALYWLNLRGGFIADVRTVPKGGGAAQTLVETVSSDALSVSNGVAYWISPDFTTLFGRRLQLSRAGRELRRFVSQRPSKLRGGVRRASGRTKEKSPVARGDGAFQE